MNTSTTTTTKIATGLLPLALVLALAACAQNDAPAATSTPAPAASEAATQAPAAETIALQSGTYRIDPTHTLVLAQWNHLGFSNPSANFGDASGQIVIDADDIANSSVNVTLPLSGMSSFTKAFDEHLLSSDFFEAARFPEARFASTAVESLGGNRYTVTGDLTIKDTTRPVVLDVTLNGLGPHPMTQARTIGFDATGAVKRSDFGLGMAAPAVSDEVALRITTEASVQDADADPQG